MLGLGSDKNTKAQRDDAFPHLVRQLVSCRLRPLEMMMTSGFIHSIDWGCIYCLWRYLLNVNSRKKGGMVHGCWKQMVIKVKVEHLTQTAINQAPSCSPATPPATWNKTNQIFLIRKIELTFPGKIYLISAETPQWYPKTWFYER